MAEIEYDLVDPSNVPGGWRWVDPDTEKAWPESGQSFSDVNKLLEVVNTHRTSNENFSVTPDDIQQQTYRWMVDNHPEAVKVTNRGARSLGQWLQGLTGATEILIWEARGRPTQVSRAKAASRAEVCLACPNNVKRTGDYRVEDYSDKLMVKLCRGKPELYPGIHGCAICSCPIAGKLQLTTEILRHNTPTSLLLNPTPLNTARKKLPAACWIRKELKG